MIQSCNNTECDIIYAGECIQCTCMHRNIKRIFLAIAHDTHYSRLFLIFRVLYFVYEN